MRQMNDNRHANPATTRSVVVLGSTGSIGVQTLDAIGHLNHLADMGQSGQRFAVVGLAAHSSAGLLAAQAERFGVRTVALADETASIQTDARLLQGRAGPEALIEQTHPDLVVAAMVGAAGLPATLLAAQRGIDIALANKETLVAAGSIIVPTARASGSRLLPCDSEHTGLWQCLQGLENNPDHAQGLVPPCETPAAVGRAILTASGGPFRNTPIDQMHNATPEQALAHPTWTMGKKNTIDSDTILNKALELIETHWLFELSPQRMGVLLHPQSIVHAIVELVDGSSIAQLSAADMRCPIQLALTWPDRAAACAQKLDWATRGDLSFSVPDEARFPALGLAYEVIEQGSVAGAVLSAANEVAVEAFLAGSIRFGQIEPIVRKAVQRLGSTPSDGTIKAIVQADAAARDFARGACARTVEPNT